MLHYTFLITLAVTAFQQPLQTQSVHIPEKLKGRSVVLVGIIDLDADKKNDLRLFRRRLIASGVKSIPFVNHEGILTDGNLNKDTMFIVVGTLSDPAQAKNACEKKAARKAIKTYLGLRKRARKLGIRAVSAKDFALYVGYKTESK